MGSIPIFPTNVHPGGHHRGQKGARETRRRSGDLLLSQNRNINKSTMTGGVVFTCGQTRTGGEGSLSPLSSRARLHHESLDVPTPRSSTRGNDPWPVCQANGVDRGRAGIGCAETLRSTA